MVVEHGLTTKRKQSVRNVFSINWGQDMRPHGKNERNDGDIFVSWGQKEQYILLLHHLLCRDSLLQGHCYSQKKESYCDRWNGLPYVTII